MCRAMGIRAQGNEISLRKKIVKISGIINAPKV